MLWAREGADLGLQIAMCDPLLMHYHQSVEKLLDYHLRITFVPPIAIHKGLRHIAYRDVLHSNVDVVLVLIRGVEFDEPLILSMRQTSRNSNKTNAPVMKGRKFG